MVVVTAEPTHQRGDDGHQEAKDGVVVEELEMGVMKTSTSEPPPPWTTGELVVPEG